MKLSRMKVVGELCRLANKPDATPRARLICIRRICRIYAGDLAWIAESRANYRRGSTIAKQGLPFTARKVEMFDLAASLCHKVDEQEMVEALANYALDTAVGEHSRIEAFGFDALCDVLNVNPTRRSEFQGAATLAELVLAGAEDCADSYKAEPGQAGLGPLHLACHCLSLNHQRLTVRPGLRLV